MGGMGNLADNIVNRRGVIHLISEDIYINVEFTEWGRGRGGAGGTSFSYNRTTAVPSPPPQTAAVPVPIGFLMLQCRYAGRAS